MNLVINGKTMNGFWRIDDVDDLEKVGLQFLDHPVAFVPHHADAVNLCVKFNRLESVYRAAKDVIANLDNPLLQTQACMRSVGALELALKAFEEENHD